MPSSMHAEVSQIAFLGLTHLGIVSSAAWAAMGEHILAVDPDPGLVARLERGDLRFSLFYLVETLIFGDAVRRATQPERLIVGASDPAVPLPDVLRSPLEHFGAPVLVMAYESAELAKTAINLYLIGAVTYANTMADLSEAVGADWSEIAPALRLDARIGANAY